MDLESTKTSVWIMVVYTIMMLQLLKLGKDKLEATAFFHGCLFISR